MEKEIVVLTPAIGGDEIQVNFTHLSDAERKDIIQAFMDKKEISFNMLGIQVPCYISLINIKKV